MWINEILEKPCGGRSELVGSICQQGFVNLITGQEGEVTLRRVGYHCLGFWKGCKAMLLRQSLSMTNVLQVSSRIRADSVVCVVGHQQLVRLISDECRTWSVSLLISALPLKSRLHESFWD